MCCNHFKYLRTMGHNLIEEVVAHMCRTAGKPVSWDSRKRRALSIDYSPYHTPDLTMLHGAPDKSHILIDIVGPSVLTQDCIASSSVTALAAATAAEASKHDMFGDVGHHQVLPFAVEDGGALGNEAMCFFNKCKVACENRVEGLDVDRQTWTAHGFSNFFFQSLSVANYRGLAHFCRSAAKTIREHHEEG